jgi:predicted transcriptional regulator
MLRITVESVEEVREDTRAAVDAVEEGDEHPAVVSFRSVGDLRKILTVVTESIAALAANLDQDYSAVHDDDVSLLADYGLLFVIGYGQPRRPYLPYERIHLEVGLVGSYPGERAAAA